MCFGSGIIRELVLLFLNIYFSKLGVMLLNFELNGVYFEYN